MAFSNGMTQIQKAGDEVDKRITLFHMNLLVKDGHVRLPCFQRFADSENFYFHQKHFILQHDKQHLHYDFTAAELFLSPSATNGGL